MTERVQICRGTHLTAVYPALFPSFSFLFKCSSCFAIKQSLGPTYFCNSWDGNGREDWVMPTKRWCTIGLRRSSPSMDPLDLAANPWAMKYGYTWEGYVCGNALRHLLNY